MMSVFHDGNMPKGKRSLWHLPSVSLVQCLLVSVVLWMAASGGEACPAEAQGDALCVGQYASIQAALDANPGRVLWVPAGDYTLTSRVSIEHDGSGLWGPGRLVQTNLAEPIVAVRGAKDVRLCGLTLTRSEGAMDTQAAGLVASECPRLVLEGVTVLDNRSPAGAIRLENCTNPDIVRCFVHNYMTISIDDRTANPDYGYAFHCIDGTGIGLHACRGALVEGNRILESNLVPAPELKAKHQLGQFVKRNAEKGRLMSQKVWDEGYVNNWHQGSALYVGSPEASDLTRIVNNHIENGAQGIDIHSDHAIVSGNVVVNCFMGMKAMHGSRNVIITGNQFSRNDLWSIGLMPGTGSHKTEEATASTPARAANVDGGSIIANNIISDFGYGSSWWIWGGEGYTRAPIRLEIAPPALSSSLGEVTVMGNVVYDTGRDAVLTDGKPEVVGPRYKYALLIADTPGVPSGLRLLGNVFHPGTEGVCNLPVEP